MDKNEDMGQVQKDAKLGEDQENGGRERGEKKEILDISAII